MSFDAVTEFEQQIANYYGASYAVATDCCTHAIELCLRLLGSDNVTCPRHTYASIPMTFIKLGLDWQWTDTEWQDYYTIGNTQIIDAAVHWQKDGYIADSYMCLSFQHKKHLSLGRGGMILLNNAAHAEQLRAMSYDGRHRHAPWAEQNISTVGYHYYMTPETANTGIKKLQSAIDSAPTKYTYKNYPDLSTMKVFDV